MTDAETIVARLVQAWEARDADAVVACFLPDGVWHNMPYPPLTGRPAIHKTAAGFLATATSVRFEIHHQASAGPDVILNERSDIFVQNDGREIVFRVMGVFEIEDGLIRVWRDYFDPAAMNPAA
jgi:limonene-1,2-epoxide hydrolase